VVIGFFCGITILGERLSGRPATIRDFFLGGRKLPWFAVSASIIATEISAVTFISLPFVVFRDGGNITYLQLGVIGSLLARVLVSKYLVPAYYEREIYSPYDYMGSRLGGHVKPMTSALFAVGGILAQCARVYVTAVVLEVILVRELAWVQDATGIPPLVSAVCAIGCVSVLWTMIGGITTVVWTDAILFLVFLAGIAITLVFAIAGLEGGMGEVLESAREAGKLRFLDTDPSPTKSYTIWVAAIAAPWWLAGVYGTDQLFAQRIFCCKNVREARLAVMTSQFSLVVTCLAALVGMSLFAYYRQHPLAGAALAMYEENGDRIFPIFIMEVVPHGLKGLILAGAFAAAISRLDSIMAALSQTSLSVLYLPRRRRVLGLAPDAPLPELEERRSLRVSRGLIVFWGVILCAASVAMRQVNEVYPSILDMALAMAGYTQGALLAGFLLAFLGSKSGRGSGFGRGFLWSAPLSVLTVFAVAWHQPFARTLCAAACALLFALWCWQRVLPAWSDAGRRGKVLRQSVALILGLAGVLALNQTAFTLGAPADDGSATYRVLAYPWYVPLGSTVAFVYGLLLRERPRCREPRNDPLP
jgi:SSS family solute:Na+ symporter